MYTTLPSTALLHVQEFERARMQAELHAKLRAFQKQGREHQKIERQRVKSAQSGSLISTYTKQRIAERYAVTSIARVASDFTV